MMAAIPTYHNAASAAEVLGMSRERARQLFQARKLPTTALLNGKKPLIDDATLMQFAADRAARKAGGAR